MILSDEQRHKLFPVTSDWAYLNTAFRGPVSIPAADAAKAYIEGLSRRGVTAWEEWQRVWDDAHTEFADFVGADRMEVQFLANATDAFSRVTLGIDWQPGDNAVVYERDYPGVVRPMLDLRRRGVSVTFVPERDDGLRSHEALLNVVAPRTRLVAASWVDYRTGCRIDAAALAAGCRERGVFCAIDAVQALGVMPVNAHEIGADVLTFAARKYLNGLDEVGALYIRKDVIEQIVPHTRGTYSVQQPFNFEVMDQPPADGARRYMLGAPSMAQVYALRAAMKLQRDTGQEAIHNATDKLVQRARALAREAKLAAYGDNWPAATRSHIVSIRRSGNLAGDTLVARLEKAGVAAAVRTGIVRVSPHWYNTEQDLARLFEALK